MQFSTAFGLIPETQNSNHTMTLLLQKVLLNAPKVHLKFPWTFVKYAYGILKVPILVVKRSQIVVFATLSDINGVSFLMAHNVENSLIA